MTQRFRRPCLKTQRGWAWLSWAIPAAAQAASALSGQDANRKAANRNIDMQREFAQNGIQWRVADAKAAGIHPLYALGGGGASFSPVQSVGGLDLTGMGQDLGRAFLQGQTQDQRNDALGDFIKRQEAAQEDRDFTRASRRLELEERNARIAGQVINNENAAMQQMAERQRLFRLNQQVGPALPSSLDDQVKVKPSEVTSRSRFDAGSTAGSHAASDRVEIAPGEFVRLPTTDQGERLEGLGEFWKTVLAPYYWFRGEHGREWDRAYYERRSEGQRKRYQHLQNQGVYPRRKGM